MVARAPLDFFYWRTGFSGSLELLPLCFGFGPDRVQRVTKMGGETPVVGSVVNFNLGQSPSEGSIGPKNEEPRALPPSGSGA